MRNGNVRRWHSNKRAHITKSPPGRSEPERAELAWSQPLQLAPARPGSFSAKSAWSQRFLTGVSLSASESAWSQASWVGVSCFRWSQRGVSGSGVESAWSQPFPVGVKLESGVSGWSQRGAGAESADCGPWAAGPWAVLNLYTPAPPPPPPPPRAATAHRQTTPHPQSREQPAPGCWHLNRPSPR